MSLYLGETLIAGNGGGYHPNIFDIKWSDHIINDIQWLRADTFSWQDGDVYTTAYNKLVEEYSTGTEEIEGDITFKRTSNGFKIATADYEANVLAKYNSEGIAWYYILDTTNKRFKLPRTKFGFEGLRTNVGDDITESLPNINGSVASEVNFVRNGQGVFSTDNTYTSTMGSQSGSLYSLQRNLSFDASRSSSTYQDNASVQERATQMYLYFYVGEFAQSSLEQTAGITSEQLNGKADKNEVWNPNTSSSTDKNTIIGWGMPDYSAGVACSNNVEFTPPCNGVFVFDSSAQYQWPTNKIQVYIDGNWKTLVYTYVSTGDYAGQTSLFILINKNFKYKFSGSRTGTFYPLLGEVQND